MLDWWNGADPAASTAAASRGTVALLFGVPTVALPPAITAVPPNAPSLLPGVPELGRRDGESIFTPSLFPRPSLISSSRLAASLFDDGEEHDDKSLDFRESHRAGPDGGMILGPANAIGALEDAERRRLRRGRRGCRLISPLMMRRSSSRGLRQRRRPRWCYLLSDVVHFPCTVGGGGEE